MRLIATALLASAVATPAAAADLSFIFSTVASGPSVYISGSGKLTINEASGVNGRFDVTGVSGSFISGILQNDNTIAFRNEGPLTIARAGSFVTFGQNGDVLLYDLDLESSTQRIELNLNNKRGDPLVSSINFAATQRAAVSIESFVPPLAPPVAPPPAPPPIFQPGAVPEPATWALMISGFGLVGGALRRRPATSSVTFA